MRATVTLLVAATLAVAAAVVAPTEVAVGPLAFPGHDRVAELDAYGADGTTAVGYVDGAGTVVELPVRNTGGRHLTVTAVDPFPERFGMLEGQEAYGLPLELAPGEERTVQVRSSFGNCAFYTERAVNRFLHAELRVRRAGVERDVSVPYPREVVLRAPTILGCPDRVTDRSARQRLLARDE